eukprot:SM000055S18312  [mRNA]  locus=s55:732017:732942:- [translate_table: standard]
MDHLSAPEMIRLLQEEAATLARMQSHINMELHHLQVEEALLKQQREATASQLGGTHGGDAAAGRGKGNKKRKQAATAEQELAIEHALAAELEAVLEAGNDEDD